MKLFTKTLVLLVAVMLFSMAGFAATSASGASSISPTLKVNVNVQTAVQLTLATAAGAPNCAITSPGPQDYSIDLGNVNGLGVATGGCSQAVATSATNATWGTQYQLTPKYSGFTATGATISLTAPAFTNASTLTLVEGNASGSMTNVPTSGTTHNFAVASSGTAVSRWLGVVVSNANGAGAFPGTAAAAGNDSTIVTFLMTVP